jgi:hypothetical protein
MNKKLLLISFLPIYSITQVEAITQELNQFQITLAQTKEATLLNRYRTIMKEYYLHMSGSSQFHHYSGCQWDPEGASYTLLEAKKHTARRLHDLKIAIEECSNCLHILATMKELLEVVNQTIKEMEKN